MDKRSKKIIITSNCVLNQNAVVRDEARRPGIMKEAVNWIDANDWGIVQLPCPELHFLGLDRPPMTVEQYDTPEFHESNRSLLEPVIKQLKEYQNHGYEIVGGIGISGSPSCDPGRGVFMNDLRELADKQGVVINFFWQIPNTPEGEFNPQNKRSIFGAFSKRSDNEHDQS
ncbi:hypothetical protein E4665_16650 [Sporolactobacillus shoreae]|uniref:DUF523 domain-containing protein n=1 Tax=Sporolactobacillus shoreae TaxID=1465501 RepID=A0A4Z0GJL1_9BACL|nr:CD3072 family TudS-related putative desulfidase [Sporolactobacillus shoreae]TGA96134.1 hypothetical protein E4665_16650 [Sporolactobacillus shoreae]